MRNKTLTADLKIAACICIALSASQAKTDHLHGANWRRGVLSVEKTKEGEALKKKEKIKTCELLAGVFAFIRIICRGPWTMQPQRRVLDKCGLG